MKASKYTAQKINAHYGNLKFILQLKVFNDNYFYQNYTWICYPHSTFFFNTDVLSQQELKNMVLTARTDLVVVDNGAMNAARYIRNILEEHVVQFGPYIGEIFIFMDDNARPHHARIVQDNLEEIKDSRMEWPARSPDPNPIEQVWDNLNRRLISSENHPAILNDLGIQLREIWEGLDQNILRSLILSMNRRCRAVINARDGNTK